MLTAVPREGRIMIVPPTTVRVLVATRPVDFCKGMDGLAALVQEEFRADSFSGVVYEFRAKAGRPREAPVLGSPVYVCCRTGWRAASSAGPRSPMA